METDRTNDPAFAPLEESGEGVAEGFEQAEEQLVDNVEKDSDTNSTERVIRDRIEEDPEAERSTAAYGDADDVDTVHRDEDQEPSGGRT